MAPKRSRDALDGIGPKSAEWLREAGITSIDQIREMGVVEAWRQVKATRPRDVSLNLLYGLEALLLGIRWDQLPPERRAELRAEVED